jgi:competence protein ComEA
MKWQFKFDEFIDKYKFVVSGILIAIILVSAGFILFASPKKGEVKIVDPSETKSGQVCKVDVEGAIRHPGVYSLSPDNRVEDAIKAAGGALANADLSKVSNGLAAKISDGQRIMIPFVVDTNSVSEASSTGESDGRININTASLAELDTLPGVGPATAQKIIDYRQQNGSFGSIEDIMKVSGIGQAKFDNMKDKITI